MNCYKYGINCKGRLIGTDAVVIQNIDASVSPGRVAKAILPGAFVYCLWLLNSHVMW